MIKFLEDSENESLFEELVYDFIKKTKALVGDEIVIPKATIPLINKGVITKEDAGLPKWYVYLTGNEFGNAVRKFKLYDDRNNSKT